MPVSADQVRPQSAAPPEAKPIHLSAATDQQIGVLLQRWPKLDAAHRRDLLAEVRKRMRLAKQAEELTEPANAELNHGSAPSLTLRIKRAQIRHSYGRPPLRQQAPQSVISDPTQAPPVDASREMVIRTTVTQILPDGSRLTREETLVPNSLRARLGDSKGGITTPAVTATASAPVQGNVRVIRTTVRFGAGFDRRSGLPSENRGRVRRVSAGNEIPVAGAPAPAQE